MQSLDPAAAVLTLGAAMSWMNSWWEGALRSRGDQPATMLLAANAATCSPPEEWFRVALVAQVSYDEPRQRLQISKPGEHEVRAPSGNLRQAVAAVQAT
jgi:hypothetical protein